MSENVCTVYVALRDHSTFCIAKDVNKAKMRKYSRVAASAFDNQEPTKNPDATGPNPIVLCQPLHEDIEMVEAAISIIAWIAAQDPANPRELSINDIADNGHGPTFQQLCELYYTCNVLGINRELRGNGIREEICAYVKIAPLSVNEYQMIDQTLAFDKGVKVTAMNNLLYLHHLKRNVPQQNEIYQYICSVGDKEQFHRIEAAMKEKIAGQKASGTKASKNSK